jgi:flagellar operon protein (TIGR03826 family)
MKLANCSRCGKVYSAVPGGRELCPACIKEEDSNYLKIFKYLSARPAATAQEIAQDTEIDVKEIYRYVRENRLRLVKGDTGLYCESCGIPIAQGKICDKCRQKLSDEIKSDIDKFKQNIDKDGPKREGPKKDEPPDPRYLKDRRS